MREIILTLFILFTSLGSFAQGVPTTTVSSLDFGEIRCQNPAMGPTPAGTYNLVFTATSGSTTHTAPATLIVQ